MHERAAVHSCLHGATVEHNLVRDLIERATVHSCLHGATVEQNVVRGMSCCHCVGSQTRVSAVLRGSQTCVIVWGCFLYCGLNPKKKQILAGLAG